MIEGINPQTMKRLIALQFQGIKTSELEQTIAEEKRIVFECQRTGRKFEFRGPKEIEELD